MGNSKINTASLPKSGAVNLVKASDIIPEPIDWLWPGWLASKKMHIIGGAPGTGKTTICLSLAATLSSGGKWPDGSDAETGNVVIWSGEDDPKDTLVPRLMASGADCSRVHFVEGIFTGEEQRMFDPARDIPSLHHKLAEVGDVRLLIIDPIVSAIQGDSHKNAEVRRGLQPLVELAESLGCALLGITHFSKNTDGRAPVERITGSLAFAAQARIVLVVSQKDMEDGSTEHVLCRAKSNIGPDSGGFTYDVQQSALEEYPNIFASAVQWGEAIEGTARELLNDSEEGTGKKPTALQKAKDYLLDTLSSGMVKVSEVNAGAKALSFSDRTLERAKSALKIETQKVGIYWYWSLPEKESQTASTKPTEKVADLAPLSKPTENTDVKATTPTKPTKRLASMNGRSPSDIGKMINAIRAEGLL